MQDNRLTLREEQVIHLIAAGKLYKEIADALDISIDTVKKHCKNSYRKLNARNGVEAAIKYKPQERLAF